VTREHVHIPATAVLMIVGAVATFSIMDATIKTMLPRLPVPFLVWARWTFQVVAMLIWLGPNDGPRHGADAAGCRCSWCAAAADLVVAVLLHGARIAAACRGDGDQTTRRPSSSSCSRCCSWASG